MKFLIPLLSLLLLMSCATPNTSKYSKIEYEAGACFGFCPIFKLTINPDRSAVIEAQRFTFTEGKTRGDFSGPDEGTFTARISEEAYDTLIAKLDAFDLNSLKNYYGNKNVTDLPTSHLRISYTNGTQKHIQDYGKNGTEALRDLYDFIENLRKSESWTKAE